MPSERPRLTIYLENGLETRKMLNLLATAQGISTNELVNRLIESYIEENRDAVRIDTNRLAAP